MKILKLGGSAITDKKAYKKARLGQIKKLAKVIAEIWKKGERDLVIVHGAGSFGHAVVLKHDINGGINSDKQRVGYADTHAACSELSLFVVKALIGEGVPAISIPPAVIIKQKNKRICEFREGILNDYLSADYLPVLYGDMVPDNELRGSVCSGDQIMAWLGKNAEFLVFVTNVGGVMDDKGNLIPEITKNNFEEVSKHLKESPNDVTGAMKGKIKELLDLNKTSYIVNTDPERVKALLMGKKTTCTKIK
ncbi:isopentenyl phosphate kinase family protein [Candidatus Micrarchaeota archaeon]|nr:isopentenyl phosphate kinase family protein [Candidatus Micrarchaeota archaeon]